MTKTTLFQNLIDQVSFVPKRVKSMLFLKNLIQLTSENVYFAVPIHPNGNGLMELSPINCRPLPERIYQGD
jgi:hypothetical protein